MKFPQASTVLDRILHLECISIITKGAASPYTPQNLFDPPEEHTYQGTRKRFEEHIQALTSSKRRINLKRFLSFFLKENILLNLTYIAGYLVDFILPICMEVFLRWVSNTKSSPLEGSIIGILILLLIFLRLIFILYNDYCCELATVWCKNSLEVSQKLKQLFWV